LSEQIRTKEDITPEAVAALAERARLGVASDRIEAIAKRLNELFDLAAPLDEAVGETFTVTEPFDPRWTGDPRA
jgi:Asp-tRNA(Asn)/Glu-tRNA(Gln) amidotransferase C subunit